MPLPDDLAPPAPHPADVAPGAAAGEVAAVTRGGVVESRHLGHGVLVAPDGEVRASVGEVSTTLLPRSVLKVWQAASLRRHGATSGGATLDGRALAIAAGSHSGRSRHVDVVTTMLHEVGLDEGDLGTPSGYPGDEAAHQTWIAEGRDASRVAYNCSGKHAAMLSACIANGWPTDGYLAPDHPVQVAIRDDVEAAVGGPVAATVVDGCGAPQHAVGLLDLARAATRLPRDEHTAAVVAAMRAHPWAVAGPGCADTVVMSHLDGVVAKNGAEGVQLLATDDGWAVLVKVLDGAGRAAMVAALALLDLVPGRDVRDAADAAREVVEGGGHPVGAVCAGTDLPSPA